MYYQCAMRPQARAHLHTFLKTLWLLDRKHNGRRNCRSRESSWETPTAVAQERSTAPRAPGRTRKGEKHVQENHHPLRYLKPDFWKLLNSFTLSPVIQSVKSCHVYLSQKLSILLIPLQPPILPFLVYSFIIFAWPCQERSHSYHMSFHNTNWPA